MPATSTSDAAAMAQLLMEELATAVKCPSDQLGPDTGFAELGLDSLGLVALSRRIGVRLGIEVDPVAAYDHPTISALAAYLAQQQSAQAGRP
jgi:acyl carrier protein